MYLELPRQYVSLRTANALCNARNHIGKEVVEVRDRLDFTIWRVAHVCLSADRKAVNVHYELVRGPGKNFVESLLDYDRRHKSLLSQFTSAESDLYSMIAALREGQITAYVLVGKGQVKKLESTYWWVEENCFSWCPEQYDDGESDSFSPIEFSWCDPHEVMLWGKRVPGTMFVERDGLERLFPATVAPATEHSFMANPKSYFPYLALMHRAIDELGLPPGKREKKQVIEVWLRANWPAELGEASREKVSYMATFLRSPEHERGGNFRTREAARKRIDGSAVRK